MGKLRNKINCGMLKRDFERFLIQGAHAQGSRGQFSFVDTLRVLQRVENIGIRGAGRGRHQALEREDKSVRRDLVTIRPFSVRAKLKIINRAGLIDGPARGGARDNFALRIVGDKTLEQFVENVAFDQGRRLMRIERSWVAQLAPVPDHRSRRAAGKAGFCRKTEPNDGKEEGNAARKKLERAAMPAEPLAQSNRTLCCATGICARTFFTRARPILAETMPLPSEALAMTWPHGSAAREWP